MRTGVPDRRHHDSPQFDAERAYVPPHVLGTLGAADRTEAVTRARQLGLIS